MSIICEFEQETIDKCNVPKFEEIRVYLGEIGIYSEFICEILHKSIATRQIASRGRFLTKNKLDELVYSSKIYRGNDFSEYLKANTDFNCELGYFTEPDRQFIDTVRHFLCTKGFLLSLYYYMDTNHSESFYILCKLSEE